jgi:hypothetical protein
MRERNEARFSKHVRATKFCVSRIVIGNHAGLHPGFEDSA